MAFDTKVRKLWAILAIPGVLLGIGASYEHGGFAGLRDLTLDVLQSAGLYRQAPDRDVSDLPSHKSGTVTPSATFAADDIFWITIRHSHNTALFEEFLRKFPNSPHAQDARVKLVELEKVPHPIVQQQPQMPMGERGHGAKMMTPSDAQPPGPDGGG